MRPRIRQLSEQYQWNLDPNQNDKERYNAFDYAGFSLNPPEVKKALTLPIKEIEESRSLEQKSAPSIVAMKR